MNKIKNIVVLLTMLTTVGVTGQAWGKKIVLCPIAEEDFTQVYLLAKEDLTAKENLNSYGTLLRETIDSNDISMLEQNGFKTKTATNCINEKYHIYAPQKYTDVLYSTPTARFVWVPLGRIKRCDEKNVFLPGKLPPYGEDYVWEGKSLNCSQDFCELAKLLVESPYLDLVEMLEKEAKNPIKKTTEKTKVTETSTCSYWSALGSICSSYWPALESISIGAFFGTIGELLHTTQWGSGPLSKILIPTATAANLGLIKLRNDRRKEKFEQPSGINMKNQQLIGFTTQIVFSYVTPWAISKLRSGTQWTKK